MNSTTCLQSTRTSLDDLESRVAQRADELARQAPTGASAKRDRETWLRAEREVFELVAGESVWVLPQ